MHKKIQSAIKELRNIHRPYEELINSSIRIKQLEVLVVSAMSYADGVSTLMKNKKYDSVSPLCRAFIELYPSIIYLLEHFSNMNEFDEYYKKMIVDDMIQDLSMYKSLKLDTTIPETDEKNRDIASYISRWENNINQYFQDKVNDIDNNDKENSLEQIINSLKATYKQTYGAMCNSKNDFIGNAVKSNRAVIQETGKEYEGAFFIYRILCSETHGNIGSLDSRIINNGKFMTNTSSKDNAYASADLIYWSLKDIALRLKDLFEQASS